MSYAYFCDPESGMYGDEIQEGFMVYIYLCFYQICVLRVR